jgi:CTP:molybdopterin cytidylyltransferase MocA
MDPAQALFVIVSAGASRRMGACKALLVREGRTLLALHLDAARAAGFGRVRVVSGAHTPEIAQVLATDPKYATWVEQLHRPDWANGGLIDSLRLAVQGEPPQRVVLVTPIDCVPASPELLRSLVNGLCPSLAQTETGGRKPSPKALRAAYAGQPGHPVSFFVELLQHLGQGDTLRTVLGTSPLIDSPDPSVLLNLNTPEDWERWSNAPWTAPPTPPQGAF